MWVLKGILEFIVKGGVLLKIIFIYCNVVMVNLFGLVNMLWFLFIVLLLW